MRGMSFRGTGPGTFWDTVRSCTETPEPVPHNNLPTYLSIPHLAHHSFRLNLEIGIQSFQKIGTRILGIDDIVSTIMQNLNSKSVVLWATPKRQI